jgi:hypothetical protein
MTLSRLGILALALGVSGFAGAQSPIECRARPAGSQATPMGNASTRGSFDAECALWQYFRWKSLWGDDRRIPICRRELRSVQSALSRRQTSPCRGNVELRRASHLDLATVANPTMARGGQTAVRRDAEDHRGNPGTSSRTLAHGRSAPRPSRSRTRLARAARTCTTCTRCPSAPDRLRSPSPQQR